MTPAIHITETYANPPTSFHIYFSHTEKNIFKDLPPALQKIVQIKAKKEPFSGMQKDFVHLEQISAKGIEHSVVVGLGKGASLDLRTIRNQTGKAAQLARSVKAEEVVVHIAGHTEGVRAAIEGLLIGDYSFDTFKGKETLKKNPHINTIFIIAAPSDTIKKEVEKGMQSATGILLARDLVNTPASHLHPEVLVAHAKDIEKKSAGRVSVTILDEAACKKLGMGAFLGVAQGSERKPAFIVLHYKGTGKHTFACVGKSITFDSGGLSLKPSEAMMDMKIDMAGGASVLGIFEYLATQQPAVLAFSDVYGVLPACENMPSGKAMKPGDVVSAMNGKTIEVLNTDAEGRLALADALVYAETILKADFIIDMATLTGACMVALGHDLAGLFSNDDGFEKLFSAQVKNTSDQYWRLPLHDDYLVHMKSSLADLKNIGGGRYAGAITAAVFLKEFVKKAKWIHIDIAGPAHSEKEGASGWGVLPIIYFLEKITNV